jgi:hypothetical protein
MSIANDEFYMKFQHELMPSERLLWSGRPNPSVIFHSDDWYVIPFSLVWTGFFVFWESGAVRNHSTFMTLWGVPFLLFGQYFVWGRFIYDAWLKRRTYYAVTDRRVLIFQEGLTQRSNTIYIEAIPSIEREGDLTGTLWFGPKLPIMGYRGSAKRDISRFALGDVPVFADIDDVNFVFSLVTELKQKFPAPPSLDSGQLIPKV